MISRVRCLLLITLGLASVANAQTKAEVRGSFGFVGFGDEGLSSHAIYAGSARIYVTRRVSFEPELQYLYHSRADKDVVLIPNVAFDFRRSDARIVPYVIGGVGWLHGIRPFRSTNESIASAGFGVKAFLTDRLYLSPDLRVGSPIHVRLSVAIGWVTQ